MNLTDLTDDQLRTLRREWLDKVDDAERGLGEMPVAFHRYIELADEPDVDAVNSMLRNERQFGEMI